MCQNPVLAVAMDSKARRLTVRFIRLRNGHPYTNPSMSSRRRLNAAIGSRPAAETPMGLAYQVRDLTLSRNGGAA